jgi:hypothetical protein
MRGSLAAGLLFPLEIGTLLGRLVFGVMDDQRTLRIGSDSS